jgi:hypothetical protein
MSVQYYGFSRMPTNLHETFTSEDLIQAKQNLNNLLHIFQELLKIDLNIQEQNKTKFYHKNQFYKEV